MVVVSNTSPISNLAIIGRLSLLREQFAKIHIPSAVQRELSQTPNTSARQIVDDAIAKGWLVVTSISTPVPKRLALGLDIGEAEALVLAQEIHAELVLLDEMAARTEARRIGLTHTGVLGVLVKARNDGKIPSLKNEISKLRGEARFFIGASLEEALLISVGEKK